MISINNNNIVVFCFCFSATCNEFNRHLAIGFDSDQRNPSHIIMQFSRDLKVSNYIYSKFITFMCYLKVQGIG